jgi:predicted nucleic acid-binding protein
VTRYLLDTNIVSNSTKPTPIEAVATWLKAPSEAEFFVSAFSIAEIERGVLERAAGRKRDELEAWFHGSLGPKAIFAGNILAFNERVASEWARIMAEGTKLGRPRSGLDMIIAATAAANGCTVVTLNDRDFRGAVATFNPMTGK